MEAAEFSFESNARSIETRFDEFIAWAEPGGSGGFNRAHRDLYDPANPFFSYSAAFLPHSHDSHRGWFVRQEFLKRAAAGGLYSRARGASEPKIKNPLALIKPGRFLSFAKAYVNVYCEIRRVRSSPKPTLRALIFIEKALRDVNQGNNDPSNISHAVFHRAALAVQRSKSDPGTQFDTGKALEHLAILLQSGGRFKGDKRHAAFPGFRVLRTNFSFRSPIKAAAKFGRKRETEDVAKDSGHLTSEEVAAVGLAYRRAAEHFGPDGVPTFFGALIGLTLTTASMRASELQSLREDALYRSGERPRLRIPRPKIGIEQDVPVSKKLGPLATEIFDVVKRHSAEARDALAFYIVQSPESVDGIHTLFVPTDVKPLLRNAYLTKEQAHDVINPDVKNTITFPQRLIGVLPVINFVEQADDIYGPNSRSPMVKIRDVISACQGLPVAVQLPPDARVGQYVHMETARKLIGENYRRTGVLQKLRALFISARARKSGSYISRDALVDYLLSDFKKSAFPHWPYCSKERSVRLDRALAVHFESGANPTLEPGTQRQEWWLPRLLSIQNLNRWISGDSRYPPLLFSLTDVKLSTGDFPRVSVQRSRRYHHTAALLAGANPLFANELAGRQSGWQGEAYDYRTPKQLVIQSIETYDPDQGSDIIGPIADEAPSPKRVVERRIFFAENASPKHVTEIGGCRSDWALDPCDMHGDCIRCGKQVWRKGDTARLPRIHEMHAEARRTIKIGAAKLRKNPRLKSIEKHIRQQLEALDRCEFILRVEADDSIPVGTLVTFSAAPGAMSSTELRSRLRKLADTEIVPKT
jgi:hypothetical protein